MGSTIPHPVRALGGESEMLPSQRDKVLAVSHRGHLELSQALRIGQRECSTSQVARIIVCKNTH